MPRRPPGLRSPRTRVAWNMYIPPPAQVPFTVEELRDYFGVSEEEEEDEETFEYEFVRQRHLHQSQNGSGDESRTVDPEPSSSGGLDLNARNMAVLFQSTSVATPSGEKPATNNANGVDSSEEDEDDDDDDYDSDYDGKSHGPNAQQRNDKLRESDLYKRYANKINVEKYEGVDHLPSGAGSRIISTDKKMTANRQKVKDKQDRATVEQVLDPRTRMILFKLVGSDKMESIDGCVSTGKEANVYHATGKDEQSYAIKVYKTSILHFKNRDAYVSGEYRFRNGYCKKNPRKMVKVWAEKEYRNLTRIYASGKVLVPKPRILKSHVLVMDFIGTDGWPAPLLKDVKFEEILEQPPPETGIETEATECETEENADPISDLLQRLYRDTIIILYNLYKHCKLVHADFSEFNLILKDNELYVIDVSQSVEHDHPKSFDFLRHDIKNVQEFFGKKILVADFKEIFDFITSPVIDDSNYMEKLDDILSRAKPLENEDVSTEVFRQTFIPRKMDQVVHYERDYDKVKSGTEDLVYTNVMGMKSDLSGPITSEDAKAGMDLTNVGENEPIPGSSHSSPGTPESDEDSEADSEVEEDSQFRNSSRPKDETPEEKRERKNKVKQEKAEKRQNKVKKHVKKRQEKLAHPNSKKK